MFQNPHISLIYLKSGNSQTCSLRFCVIATFAEPVLNIFGKLSATKTITKSWHKDHWLELSDFNFSGVNLRPWTFQWDLTLYLLIWTVLHINISVHQWRVKWFSYVVSRFTEQKGIVTVKIIWVMQQSKYLQCSKNKCPFQKGQISLAQWLRKH